jgi:Novel toxin 15
MAEAATLLRKPEAASKPAPVAAAPAPMQRITDGRPAYLQRGQAPSSAATVSSEVVDISTNAFAPSQNVKDEIEAQGSKGLDVRVVVKGLTEEGRVKVRADNAKKYDSVGKGSMPILGPWAQRMGGMHLNFGVVNGEVSRGYASLTPRGGDSNDWLQAVQKNSALLGGLGLKVTSLPTPVNKFEGGKLIIGVENLKVEIGGFLDALFNLSIENAVNLKADATADVNIKGVVKGQLKLDNSGGGLVGEVSLAVDYASFSGAAKVKYTGSGPVDVSGKAAYSADKLSGEIQFVATDLDSANKFAKDAISAAGGKENVQNAPAPAPVPVPKEGQKKRALAATGQLGFNLTKWFAGTVNVVVDGKGAITVIGKIAPPAEIELFKQKDWDKEIIKFEAKAYYGIPVVGNLNLFANIGLHAIAKLGPAKIYNIEILGTYSTDPAIQKSIQISGSINISAYGGLRLRAEGGAGVEILDHDLKFGIGLNADVGVKAYADARPTIGYREPGVFYVSGVLELVAQPILGLGGDFFIALETPWWSPLSNDRWTWPLFSKEWPLTDPIGISASVKDYVLGSGAVPEIELKKPEFDPSKFMSNMVDKTLPDKSGGPGSGKGSFKEDGSVPKPIVPPKKPTPQTAAGASPKKGPALKGGKSGAPDPAAEKGKANTRILQSAAKPLAALKGKGALTRGGLDQELAAIKAKVSGVNFDVGSKGAKWLVKPKAGGESGKGIELGAKEINGKEEKPDERSEQEKSADLTKAIAEVQKLLDAPNASRSKVADGLKPIKKQYRMLALDLVVDSRQGAKETVHVHGAINPTLDSKPKEWVAGMELVQVEFNIRLRKFNPVEFRGQLSQQERGINAMKMSQWATNRTQFLQTKEESEDGSGRSEVSATDQRVFREYLRNKIKEVRVRKLNESETQAEKFADGWLSTRAALHGPDQVAGGGRMAGDAEAVGIDESSVLEFKKRSGLVGVGSARINSSIGSQWKNRIGKVDLAVNDAAKYSNEIKEKANMNVQLIGVEIQ